MTIRTKEMGERYRIFCHLVHYKKLLLNTAIVSCNNDRTEKPSSANPNKPEHMQPASAQPKKHRTYIQMEQVWLKPSIQWVLVFFFEEDGCILFLNL